MKQVTIIISILISIHSSFGQVKEKDSVFVKSTISENEFRYDTLFFEKGIANPPVLVGTTVLKDSEKNFLLQNKGLYLDKIEVINGCNEGIDPRTFKNYPKFEKIVRDSNSLTIDVTIISNCCYEFLGEAEVIGTDTLNLIYTGYGNYCSCSCCFTLRYTFDTSMEHYYNILEKVMINNNQKVIELINN